jgi:hypothetical protein
MEDRVMSDSDRLETLFVVWAFLFQTVLIVHFALRKWRFDVVVRYGWIVYALGIPAGVVSVLLLRGGKPWSLWLGGFIHLVWSIYGYTVEFVKGIRWRYPIRWPVAGPYLFLYLATLMFYWWPLWHIGRPLWYVYAVLYVVSTVLNVTSHKW